MQSVDIEANDEEKLEKLAQDFGKPFGPPADIRELISKDFPSLDTGVDPDEWYNAGGTIASVADIIKNDTVLNYSRPIKMPRTKVRKAGRKSLIKNKQVMYRAM